MYLQSDTIKRLAKQKGWKLGELLKKAGVSRTAYYSLLRQDDVLPRSVQKLAEELEVSPQEILQDDSEKRLHYKSRLKKLNVILKRHPQVDRENVWHTLILLELDPWKRLDLGLIRGQKFNFYR